MLIIRSTIAADEILQKVRDSYDGRFLDAMCMFEYRGVNDVYRFKNGSTSTFLKIFARTGMDKEAVEAEVAVVNYLKHSGLSVAYPISMVNGGYLLPIETPEGTKYGVLFSEAEGVPLSFDMLNEVELLKVCRLLSDMHTILDAMPTSLKRWKLDEGLFLDRSIEILENYKLFNPQIDLVFLKDVVKELKLQIKTKAGSWNWGLCHGDIYLGNIHRREDGGLTIFDFDFCGYGWRAYDVSPFLGGFSTGVQESALDQRKQRLDAFLRGYKNAGGFSDSEVEAVYKVFVPFRRIFNMGYLYNELYYVWGNRIREWQITNDTNLLRELVDYYW